MQFHSITNGRPQLLWASQSPETFVAPRNTNGLADLFTQVAQPFFAIGALVQGASTPSGGSVQVRILNTKKEGTVVTRRIQLSDNTCIDETIDAYTGRRIDRKKVPCSKF